jgi:PAS domain S-box-containing protein
MTAQEQAPLDVRFDDVGDEPLLRAALYDAVEPWALLKAVRDDGGTIVDFVYRDLNRAAAGYAVAGYRGRLREDFLGHSIIRTMPDVIRSGLFDLCARCVDTGDPMIVDDFMFQPEAVDGERRYEGRGVRIGTDYLSLMWRDVNDRFESSRRVAESEERYRLLAENSSDVVAHVRDNVVIWVSPSVLASFGAPPSFWIGQPISKFMLAEDLPVFAEILDQTATGESIVRRLHVLDADGVAHWTEIHVKLFYDAAGDPDGRTASLRVIDREVAAETALERARGEQAHADARYRKLIDKSVIATSMHTTDGRFTTVNQAMCDFFGYDAATLLTKTWQELTPTEYLEQDRAADADILAGRRDSFRTTKQYIHADGHRIWGDLLLSCMRSPDGEVEHIICQIVDITAAMEAREQLLISEERNRVLAQDLQAELNSAAHYLRAALPEDLAGPVTTQSRYLPSQTLGGDFFDFLWVDDDNLIVYLLDVSGHGVQSSLVAISAHNLLRSSAMSAPTLLHPSRVLGTMNRHFAMERHDGNYLTIFYGVYQKSSRTLRYASAGHPPAMLFTDGTVISLPSQSTPAGMFEETTFPATVVSVPPGSELLLYSDGAYELPRPGGGQLSQEQFVDICARLAETQSWSLDGLIADVLAHSTAAGFEDDCSLVKLSFE